MRDTLMGAIVGGVFQVGGAAVNAIAGTRAEGAAQSTLPGELNANELTTYEEAQKKTASTGEERYSFRDKKVPTYDELVAKPDMQVVDIRNENKGTHKEQRTELLNSEEVAQMYQTPTVNRDTGELVFITSAAIKHSFTNRGISQIDAIRHLPEIIENAVLTHAEPATHGADNVTGVYTLFAAVQTEEGIQPVKLKVKEYEIGPYRLPQTIQAYFDQNGTQNPYASVYDNRVLELESIENEEASSSATPTLTAQGAAQGGYPSASSWEGVSSSMPPTLTAQGAAQGGYPSASSWEGVSSSMPPTLTAQGAAQGEHPSTPSKIKIADLYELVNSEYQKYLPERGTGRRYSLAGEEVDFSQLEGDVDGEGHRFLKFNFNLALIPIIRN